MIFQSKKTCKHREFIKLSSEEIGKRDGSKKHNVRKLRSDSNLERSEKQIQKAGRTVEEKEASERNDE